MDQSTQRDQWGLVAATGLAVFMGMLDMSVVNLALPVIERDLGVPTHVAQFVVLGYLVPLVAVAVPSGRWLDEVGRRATLALSVLGFAAASVMAGLAPNIYWLIGARAGQGIFAAVLFALTPVLATIAVRPESRGRAMGIVSTIGPLGAVSGPPLGGYLVETVGWEWIFFINVPVSVAVVWVGFAQLPKDRPLRLPKPSLLIDAGLLGGASVAVLLGLSQVTSRGPGSLALLLVAIPLLAGWLRIPQSRPVRVLLSSAGMAQPHLGLMLGSAATGLALFLLPFYLQNSLDLAADTTGLTILALSLTLAVFGPVGGALADGWGARATATTGAAIMSAGLALVTPLSSTWTPLDVAWRLAILGAGGGLFAGPVLTLAMSRAPKRLLGTTGATTSLFRQLGFSLGPALGTTVWALSGYTAAGMRTSIVLAAVLTLSVTAVIAAGGTSPRVDRAKLQHPIGSNTPDLQIVEKGK